MTVSSSRNSTSRPRSARSETIAPIGRPRYSAGKIAAEARPSASRSPRHDTSVSAASSTTADMRMASSAIAVPASTSPTQRVEVTPIDASSVTVPAAIVGIGKPHAPASRAYSTKASSSSASASAKNTAAGANQPTATAIAISTAPLSTRVISVSEPRRPQRAQSLFFVRFVSFVVRKIRKPGAAASWSLRGDRHRRRLDPAVAAIPLLVGDYGLEQVAPAEIGPQRVGHPDLGIRDLPEQEIADAHFAARPDQQIRIGLARRVEKPGEPPLVEIVRPQAGRDRAARRVHDFGAAAVVQRDVEQHPGVGRRLPDAELEFVLHVGRKLLGAADDAKRDVVLEQRAELEADVSLEQRHQRVDFGTRPLPVLDRERVQREDVDPKAGGGFHHVAHRVDASAMAFDAGQMALRRPASVPIHDDRD